MKEQETKLGTEKEKKKEQKERNEDKYNERKSFNVSNQLIRTRERSNEWCNFIKDADDGKQKEFKQ